MSDDSPMEKKLTAKVVTSSKPLAKVAETPLAQKGGRSGNNGRQFRDSGPPAEKNFDRRFAQSNNPTSSTTPTKNKSFVQQEKRWQPRSSTNFVRDRMTAQSADAEVGSVSRPGSKKGAIVECLNFSYDSPTIHQNRLNREFTYVEPNRGYHRTYTATPSYNKEQYLLANCQFIVAEGFDYGACLANPDLLVDWDHIEELRLVDQDVPSCPICLHPPMAAKITRCGHIYCWSCILHYLALSDKQWRKCPICYESVYKNQLRSVVSTKVDRYDDGKTIVLRLMRREKGTNLVAPAATWDAAGHHVVQVGKINGANDRFAKFLTCSVAESRAHIISREKNDLLTQLAVDGDEPEAIFIREALKMLAERETSLESIETLREIPSSPALYGASPPKSLFHRKRHSHPSACYDWFNEVVDLPPIDVENRSVGGETDAASTVSSTDPECHESSDQAAVACAASAVHTNETSFYFYQSDDGQPVYLHPLNARCLMYEYGSLDLAPPTISGVVTQIETMVMNEDLRRRYRYLSHLPLTTVFSLVELNFADEILTRKTIDHFYEEFAKRKRLRERKARDVHRLQQQAQRWEKAVLMDPRNFSRPASSAPHEIPVTTLVQSAQREIEASLTASEFPVVSSPPVTGCSPIDEQQSSLSFAQMLKQGKPKPIVTKNDTSQTAMAPVASASSLGEKNVSLKNDDDEYLPAPSYQKEFEDALQAAFDHMNDDDEKNNDNDDVASMSTTTSKNKKKTKKNKKGKLLFSTGSAFAPGLH